jgi:transcriptional regulator with XRE-family HTH domain
MEAQTEESKELLKRIGKKIYERRKDKNLTQEQLAELLGMTASGFAKIERGASNISVSRIAEIAKKLEMDMNDLINIEKGDLLINCNGSFNMHNQTVNVYEKNPTEIELLKSAFTDMQKAMEMVVKKLELLENGK